MDVLRVFNVAYEAFDDYGDIRAANAGSEWPDLTRHQVIQVYGTLGICSEVFSHFGYTLPLSARVGGAALPLLVWGVQHYMVDGPHAGARELLPDARRLNEQSKGSEVSQLLKKLEKQAEKTDSYASRFVNLVHPHISNACLAVSIAHSLVLLQLGERLQGSLILGLALYAPVEKRVSHKVRMPIRLILQHVALVSAVRYGNWIDRVFGAASLVSLTALWAQILGIKLGKTPSKPIPEKGEKYDESALKLSEWHWKAYENPMVAAPKEEVQFDQLQNMIDKIDWNEAPFSSYLKEHVELDGEWQKTTVENRGSMETFMKAGMDRFLQSIRYQKVDQGGELRDWSQVIAKAKHVTLALQEKEPRSQARYLIRLAVAAGWHCADAYKGVVNDCYKELCNAPANDLEGAIQKALAGLRAKKFDEVLHNPPNRVKPFMSLFNIYDDHNAHLAVWVFGREAGHPDLKEASDDLHMASGHWPEKVILRAGWHKFSDQFWNGYTVVDEITAVEEKREGYSVKAVVDEIHAATRLRETESKIASPVIKSGWVREWLQEKYPNFEQIQADFYDEESGVLKREVIVEMLVDHGVFVPNQAHS